MIARVWHGWTTPENAETYQNLLMTEVIPGIAAMKIPGYRRIQVLRRLLETDVEFVTIMWFDSLDAVKAFVGEDYTRAHVPAEARAVLARFDERAQHYDFIDQRDYSE